MDLVTQPMTATRLPAAADPWLKAAAPGEAQPGIRRAMTRAMVLVAGVSVVMAAAWMGLAAWARAGGQAREGAQRAAQSLAATLDDFQSGTEFLAQAASTDPALVSRQLHAGDLLLSRPAPRPKALGPGAGPGAAAAQAALADGPTDGLFIHAGALYCRASWPAGADPRGRLILLRRLRQADLDRIPKQPGAEVAILADGRYCGGSFRDLQGRLAPVAFPPSLWGRIASSAGDSGAFSGVPLTLADGGGPRRVAMDGSTIALRGPAGRIVAYGVGMMRAKAPAEMVARSLIGALFLLVALCSLAFVYARHLAGRLLDPLSDEIQRLYRIGQGAPAAGGRPFECVPAGEFEMLRHAISQVEAAIAREKRIGLALEEERARSLFSSKMATLGEMAAGVAHEINTPLAVISTRADQLNELLQEAPLDLPTALKVSQSIPVTVQRIAKIVQGLRAFAREGSQEDPRPVPVEELLEDVLSLCSERFKLHSVRLDLPRLPEGLSALCRPTEVLQVLLNLLNNAFDAVNGVAGSWVRIDCSAKAPLLQVVITDSGNGIEPGLADKVFQPFFTTKGPGRGTGLGLSISKGIAHSNGGTLTLEPSMHTRFVLRLPLA
jgi:signal transduction histidine kinase